MNKIISIIKQTLGKNIFLTRIYKDYLYYKYKYLYERNPKAAADSVYYKTFAKHIDWDNPKDLNEKIHWMLIHTDTSLWTLCADKYRVREYVRKKGCGDLLVELYGMWNTPEEIDFDKLPEKFVLKANNGCGTVKLITDKRSINQKKLIHDMERWLKRPFGYMSAQSHYLCIKPCIIAEELLEESEKMKRISPSSLIDYKVWCINGVPECILVILGREGKHYFRQVFNTKWEKMPDVLAEETHHSLNTDIEIPKPSCLDQMLECSKRLSADFPEVRVDFYVIGNRLYFGELTFTAGMGSLSYDYYLELGEKIDLSQINRIV